jgi:hypothetical protein
MNSGILPIGLTTTNKQIIDFGNSSINVLDITNAFKELLYKKSINCCIGKKFLRRDRHHKLYFPQV